jgi:serine/threonine protein phosphatase PrpC
MLYDIAQKSIIGRRDEQQDSWFVHHGDNRVFSAVCDGMGGRNDGRAASEKTAETMKRLFLSKTDREAYPEFFIKAIDVLDESVFSRRDSEGRKISAGTTIIAVAIEEDSLNWLSVGDSRLYIIRGGSIVRVTRDHNYFLSLDRMVESGSIDLDRYDKEAAKGERLISYIGMGGIQVFDINDAPLKLFPSDMVLLCSDGLYRAIDDTQILGLAASNNPEEMICSIFDESKREFTDNTTCIIVKYKGG